MALLVRTWVGHKDFNYCDPETGERRKVHHGDEVKVSPAAIKAFGSNFVDSNVAKAKAAAKDAEKAAEEEVKTSSGSGSRGKKSE